MSGATTLKSLSFTDIILGDGGAYLKGVPKGKPLERLNQEKIADLEELRQKLNQDSRKEFSVEHDTIRYRVARIESIDGQWFALRRAMNTVPVLSQLGFAKTYQSLLCSADLNKGLVVFCGGMGSGKTTSASALVKTRLQSFGGHAITLEDPPELPLQGIHGKGLCLQKEVTDFGQAIIESLRYGAPEIIYLGELRAPSDVSQALRAAVNGHLIIATIHAGSVIEAAQRISSLGSAVDGREMTQDLMASGLGVFVHQTLNTVKETGLKSLKVEFLQVAGEQGLSAQSLIRAGKMIQLGSEIMLQRNKLLLGKK